MEEGEDGDGSDDVGADDIDDVARCVSIFDLHFLCSILDCVKLELLL